MKDFYLALIAAMAFAIQAGIGNLALAAPFNAAIDFVGAAIALFLIVRESRRA